MKLLCKIFGHRRRLFYWARDSSIGHAMVTGWRCDRCDLRETRAWDPNEV